MSHLKRKVYRFLDETLKWLSLITVGLIAGIVTLLGTIWFWGAPMILVSIFHVN